MVRFTCPQFPGRSRRRTAPYEVDVGACVSTLLLTVACFAMGMYAGKVSTENHWKAQLFSMEQKVVQCEGKLGEYSAALDEFARKSLVQRLQAVRTPAATLSPTPTPTPNPTRLPTLEVLAVDDIDTTRLSGFVRASRKESSDWAWAEAEASAIKVEAAARKVSRLEREEEDGDSEAEDEEEEEGEGLDADLIKRVEKVKTIVARTAAWAMGSLRQEEFVSLNSYARSEFPRCSWSNGSYLFRPETPSKIGHASFLQFLNREGLVYVLTDGTMLGAVRHGGAIPFDQDFDLVLPVWHNNFAREVCRITLSSAEEVEEMDSFPFTARGNELFWQRFFLKEEGESKLCGLTRREWSHVTLRILRAKLHDHLRATSSHLSGVLKFADYGGVKVYVSNLLTADPCTAVLSEGDNVVSPSCDPIDVIVSIDDHHVSQDNICRCDWHLDQALCTEQAPRWCEELYGANWTTPTFVKTVPVTVNLPVPHKKKSAKKLKRMVKQRGLCLCSPDLSEYTTRKPKNKRGKRKRKRKRKRKQGHGRTRKRSSKRVLKTRRSQEHGKRKHNGDT